MNFLTKVITLMLRAYVKMGFTVPPEESGPLVVNNYPFGITIAARRKRGSHLLSGTYFITRKNFVISFGHILGKIGGGTGFGVLGGTIQPPNQPTFDDLVMPWKNGIQP